MGFPGPWRWEVRLRGRHDLPSLSDFLLESLAAPWQAGLNRAGEPLPSCFRVRGLSPPQVCPRNHPSREHVPQDGQPNFQHSQEAGSGLRCFLWQAGGPGLTCLYPLLPLPPAFETEEKHKDKVKIQLTKGRCRSRQHRSPSTESAAEDEAFLKGPDLEFVATVGAEEKQATLTTSPELKPKRKQRLRFLTHSLACACPLCSDVALVVVGLRWFVAFAHGELALGNEAEGLGLLQAALERCAPATTRFSGVVRAVSWGKKTVLGAQPTSGLLDDVMGRVYAALAAHNLRGHQPQKQLWELVEAGLAFLSSRPPHLPGLECHAASLLLTKAVATIYTLASAHDGCTANVFSSTWAWKPSAPPAGTKGTAAAKAPKAKEPQPPKSRSKKQPAAIAGMKPRAKQGLGAKALPPIDLDVFTLGDSDTDVPRIVLKPVLEPATPIQKSCPPPMARSQGPKRAPQPQAPFAVFNEASPTGVKAQLAKAPKASRRVKSRLKVSGWVPCLLLMVPKVPPAGQA